jgi:hypothetical protein
VVPAVVPGNVGLARHERTRLHIENPKARVASDGHGRRTHEGDSYDSPYSENRAGPPHIHDANLSEPRSDATTFSTTTDALSRR